MTKINGECITFITGCGRFQISVKPEFVRKYGEGVLKEDIYNLNVRYNFSKYLHNPLEAAIVDLQYGVEQYFIDGRKLTDKEWYNLRFYDDVEKILEI